MKKMEIYRFATRREIYRRGVTKGFPVVDSVEKRGRSSILNNELRPICPLWSL